jgi:hypothetical protein
VDAGAGPDVEDVVGLQDRVLVVLDDDDCVAEVAQALQRAEQALVVALVEADRGLVEDVQNARQARADLAREADALALAAGEGTGGAGEGEVFESDVDQEGEAVPDLLQDATRDAISLCFGESLCGSSPNQTFASRTASAVASPIS